jgi:cell wall-associated NlpC family hydrolase
MPVKSVAIAAVGIALILCGVTSSPAPAHIATDRSARKAHIVERARDRIGARYCWGGTRRCFDCSGLTYRVYRDHGAALPRSTRQQWRARFRDGWGTILTRPDLRRGDLVFFHNTYRDGISHVAIYIGQSRFVHAGDRVEIDSFATRYWRRHFHAGVRPRLLRNQP